MRALAAMLGVLLWSGATGVEAQASATEPPATAAPAAPATKTHSDARTLSTTAPPRDAPAAPSRERMVSTLELLTAKGLALAPARSVEALEEVLERAHQLTLDGRKDEAAMALLEVVEGPRFFAFEELDAFAAAELALASLLLDQHALATAQRMVERLLARGPDSKTFGPAVQRAVDLALARRDYARSAARLERLLPAPRSPHVEDELGYLRGLSAHDEGRDAEARRALAAIREVSRFYPSAQYLLGTLAARHRDYDEARARFCKVRSIAPPGAPRALYTTPRLALSDDLARLGLARVAHERGREKEAFDHYFRVPADSPLLAEALFESAYASYERGHHTAALDSLAELEARYPRSAFTAEARVLRGYAHLGRCDFARAERELVAFERTFGAVLRELDETLASPARVRGLYESARGRERERLLDALVSRDPEVERLRAMLAALSAELARSSQTGRAFAEMATRVRGGETQHARLADDHEATQDARVVALAAQLATLRRALAAFKDELRALRRGDAAKAQLRELEAAERALMIKSQRVEARLRELVQRRERRAEPPTAVALAQRLDQERAYVAGVHSRAARVREELARALGKAERRALLASRERLAKELRRARIGRIDAVMGKKRKLELEVESLAAGRFPPEPARRSTRPALLRDDEEYWPFEGEDWPDEFGEPAPASRSAP